MDLVEKNSATFPTPYSTTLLPSVPFTYRTKERNLIMNEPSQEPIRYETLPLSSTLQKALAWKGYTHTTAVQSAAIPPLLDRKDVIAKAPTGTGKTFAFGIPIVEHIDPESDTVQAVVLAPTRELAIQIRDEFRDLCMYKTGVRVVCLYGGKPIKHQIMQLKKRPQIIVATPGRLSDHIQRHTVRLDHIDMVVLDEADRMLDMGFIKDVTKLLDMMKHRKHLALFSATISREVMDISWVYQREPVEITVEARLENKPDIKQYRLDVPREEKVAMLKTLLALGQYERAIVFCNTKNMADRLVGMLTLSHISSKAIHGDIPQKLRESALKAFKSGEISILVATDVAARGIDIEEVDVVFNYDIPDEAEYYIHRIGRTGRAKRHGVSYSFVSNITECIKLDEISKNHKAQVEAVTLNEQGQLIPIQKNEKK